MEATPPNERFVLTRAAARALDAQATVRYGIPGIVLMENAARGAAAVALEMMRTAGLRRASIVCGAGSNGGDGWAMARHLHNAGVDVLVLEVGPSRSGTDAAINRDICLRMAIPARRFDEIAAEIRRADAGRGTGGATPDPWRHALVVDALFGTGLDRAPQGVAARAIDDMNRAAAQGCPVLAVDVPSGLDADSGVALGAAVRAAATVTFVAPKPGLLAPSAAGFVGRLVVVGIGAPRELEAELLTRLGPC